MLTELETRALIQTKRDQLTLATAALNKAQSEGRTLNKEESAVFEGRKEQIQKITAQLEGAAVARSSDNDEFDALMKRANEPFPTVVGGREQVGQRVPAASGPFLTRSQKVSETAAFAGNGDNLDPGKAIRGQITGNWENADAERRAMAGSVGSTGGFLLTPQMSGILVDLARNQSVCVQAGAVTALMDTSEMVIGRQITDPTAAWIPEGGTIQPSDITFDKVTLKATVLAAMVKISIQLSTDAANIDSLIRNALSGAIGAELDRAALMGSGIAEPRGLFYTPDVQTYSLGANGAVISNFDAFSYAAQYVQNENGQASGLIMSPRSAGALDRLKEAQTNAPLQAPASYAALSKFVTKQIPDTLTHGTSHVASAAIVGNFSQIVMGLAPSEGGLRGIRIDVSREAAFSTMELLIRAYIRADIAILRPKWFTLIKGILA